LRRFKEREKIEFKRFKITEEDWRNREKWDAYQEAICDMVDRTSTGTAPWTLVEANDKGYARVKVLRTICERVEAELEGKPIPQSKPEKPPKEKKSKEMKSDKKQKATAKPAAAAPSPPKPAPAPAAKPVAAARKPALRKPATQPAPAKPKKGKPTQ
jgi:cell division protein FtsN